MFLPLNRCKVVGHSMEPSFKGGDTLWLNRWSYLFSSPKLNDVVVIKHENVLFLKRVRRLQGNSYLLTGDNPFDSYNFQFIKRGQILGKVITAK